MLQYAEIFKKTERTFACPVDAKQESRMKDIFKKHDSFDCEEQD
jgi:hypothetical protein